MASSDEDEITDTRKIGIHTLCRILPKVELHAHLNGSLSENTLQKLGCLDSSISEYKKLATILHKTDRTLEECFDLFKVAHNATKTPELVYLATQCVIEDFALENTMYLEIRTTPRAEEGMTKEEYIESVVKAIEESKYKTRIIVKLILSIDRRHSKQDSLKSLEIILKMREKYPDIIRGIDLSGNPKEGDFDDAIFEAARQKGLGITIHCAEVKNDLEVEKILAFVPNRIGHGTFLHPNNGGSEKNWKTYCEQKIPLECCLTSNVVCGTSSSYEEHHIKEWIDHDLPFSICTDDKGVFSTSLCKEYELVQKHFKLSFDQLWQISFRSVKQSFATDVEQRRLMYKLFQWYYFFIEKFEVDSNIADDFGSDADELYAEEGRIKFP
ncbi:hypothetical protein JTB14_005798 [Gonioctena quinquepunctata]|nr:hypothetical protein JTB14_005798 [Gonioctena quinquepunctata]